MDILIRNMEMPKSCDQCRLWLLFLGRYFCFGKGVEIDNEQFPYEFMSKDRLPDCPLVEVPKHGRLIDADNLLKELSDCEMKTYGYNGSCDDCEDRNICSVRVLRKDIEDAPTVLDAEEYECPHYQGICGLDESIICFAKSNENCPVKTSGKARFNCSAPNCLDCERNDDCNSIEM